MDPAAFRAQQGGLTGRQQVKVASQNPGLVRLRQVVQSFEHLLDLAFHDVGAFRESLQMRVQDGEESVRWRGAISTSRIARLRLKSRSIGFPGMPGSR